jgi:hypothetical protein
VNSYTTGEQKLPEVCSDPSGGFVVVWEGAGAGDAGGIFARRYDALGAPDADHFSSTAIRRERRTVARVECVDVGGFVVAWTGTNPVADSDGTESLRSVSMRLARTPGPNSGEYVHVGIAGHGRRHAWRERRLRRRVGSQRQVQRPASMEFQRVWAL